MINKMQHSDEEEDFLSADEDGFDGHQETANSKQTIAPEEGELQHKVTKNASNNQVIDETETKSEAPTEDPSCVTPSASKKTSSDGVQDAVESSEPVTQFATKQDYDDKANSSASNSGSDEPSKGSKNLVANEEEDDEDDEEALAERIRERNLKIARKFSAEIAKNLKVSAPIPVKMTSSVSQSNRDTDYSTSSPGTPSSKSSFLPPAPPPTPALSSSFSNLNDQTLSHQSSTASVNVAPTQPSMNSQYSWRVPTTKTKPQQHSQQDSGSNSPSSKVRIGGGEDQARQVLDRLAEKLSHTDKNLFERVTEDIKKVSIKNEEIPLPVGSNLTSQLPPLSSITDLGSTLGGWGWSGATKLLSSASQVTSHMGSVLDSVLLSEERFVRPEGSGAGVSGSSKQPPRDESRAPGATNEQEKEITRSSSGRGQAAEVHEQEGAMPGGDPLVDFTLSAMESLGKKAFGVMTTRDQSGSLQIKGLGRPWEHLLNTKRTTNDLDMQQSDARNDVQKNQQRPSRSPSPPPRATSSGVDEMFAESSIEQSRAEIDKPQLPSTLKNRRKQRYDGDD